MALTPPHQAIYPKKYIRDVQVLYDGSRNPNHEFSIAKLTLHDGGTAYGVRHDRNEWNENTEELGYPTVRGGRPSWFIMPKIDDLIDELVRLKKEGKIKVK